MPVDMVKGKGNTINWLSHVTAAIIVSYSKEKSSLAFPILKDIKFQNLRKKEYLVYCNSLN